MCVCECVEGRRGVCVRGKDVCVKERVCLKRER